MHKQGDILTAIYTGPYDGRGITPLKTVIYSADRFDRSEESTTTEMAKKLSSLEKFIPFTVEYAKKDGSIRRLRGRVVSTDFMHLGRTLVEDFDLTEDVKRFRQIDNRSIKTLVVDGVRYAVKGY